MPQWPTPSNNSILVSGVPLEYEYEAGGTIYPGMGVIHTGANSYTVQACTEESDVLCIADISMASFTGRGSWRKDGVQDLPYLTGDQLKCISGSVTVMLLLAPLNQTINEGDKLECAGSGVFREYACLHTSDPCALVAEAMEEVTTTTLTDSVYIHAKLLI